ncbi:hypothetical protein OF83DRAFT_1179123 [Amylostereum chailletii]|nr:hypothetical protein OF83DRAFT_1179123 [Amylostereum chailletii]
MTARVLSGVAKLVLPSSSRDQRLPITYKYIVARRDGLDLGNSRDAAVWAITSIAFWECCRLGELLIPSVNTFDAEQHVAGGTDANVKYSCAISDELPYATFRIPWTKTKHRAGAEIKLTDIPDETLPVQALRNHLRVNKDIPDGAPLFAFKTEEGWAPIILPWFKKICNKIWQDAKLDCIKTGHSFRIGRATEWLLRGLEPNMLLLRSEDPLPEAKEPLNLAYKLLNILTSPQHYLEMDDIDSDSELVVKNGAVTCPDCQEIVQLSNGGINNFKRQHWKSKKCLKNKEKRKKKEKEKKGTYTLGSWFSASSPHPKSVPSMVSSPAPITARTSTARPQPALSLPLAPAPVFASGHQNHSRSSTPVPSSHNLEDNALVCQHAVALLQKLNTAIEHLPVPVPEARETDQLAEFVAIPDIDIDPREAWETLDPILNRLLGYGATVEDVAKLVRRGDMGVAGLRRYIEHFVVKALGPLGKAPKAPSPK